MTIEMPEEETSVLIVGGGLVGLSAAMFLSFHKVPTILVEKHPASSVHPRAVGYTARTFELFHSAGFDSPEIPQVDASFRLRRVQAESLAGEWSESTHWNPNIAGAPKVVFSPSIGSFIAQDRLEPLIRQHAENLGADVRFDVRMLDFSQNEAGVRAIVCTTDGKEYIIRAQYMVAADGHRSDIREGLKIKMKGRGHLRTLRSILFRADLDRFLEKGVQQFSIKNENVEGFLTSYGDGRWVFMLSDDEERDIASQRQAVLHAVGIPDLELDIITTGRWELSARIAERYSCGRILLAGDAAHTLPPTRGGYGANTGIHDVGSLAWKLASVIGGISKPDLLDTFNDERQPVGWNRHQQTFARPDYAAMADPTEPKGAILDDDAMELGELYRSAAVLADNLEDLPIVKRPDEWLGQPGTRAPHVWLTENSNNKRISTIHVLGGSWVVMTEDPDWREIVRKVGDALAVEIKCIVVGEEYKEEEHGAFGKMFGLKRGGASLIRPDGVTAWRSVELPSLPEVALTHAVGTVLCSTRI